LIVGGVFALLLTASAAALFLSTGRLWPWQETLEGKLDLLLSSKNHLYYAFTLLYGIALATAVALLLTILPVSKQFLFLQAVILRLSGLTLWIFAASVLGIILLALLYREVILKDGFLSPIKTTVWILLLLTAYILVVMDYQAALYLRSLKRFESPLIGLGIFLLAWAWLSEHVTSWRYGELIKRIFLLTGIFLVTLVLYQHIAAWINWVHKSSYSYWNLLAEQLLHGKLYLENPPTTHDLTLYHGNWYIPNPPVPAMLMLPLAFFIPAAEISAGDFSMFFCAVNTVLIFLILDQLIQRRWIKLSQNSALWLVALFAFGTNHLWVGINARIWFLSQILTVTFLAFATLAALKAWPAWLVGASMGLAIGARPTSIATWPFVFAIAMQIIKDEAGNVNLKQALAWSIQSLIPLGLAIAGLLLYNQARFDNFLDFGYTTINGNPTIVKNAQTYGIFSPHFIPSNLDVMFLYAPIIQWDAPWPILPSTTGMSIFLSTPPLLYLFHRYERKYWILGAWVAVFLNFALLAMYHNTGSDQFGYRYILDAIVPLIALLATTFDRKIPWHFILLTVLSIVINIYGANWFMNA
jgi:hypothetical protein